VQHVVGMVVRTDGPQVTVRDANGQEWRCILRGRLRRLMDGATTPVVVGDRVDVCPSGEGQGVVHAVHPRRSRLARRAVLGHDEAHRGRARRAPREQVLVANIDLAVIVVAAPPRATVIDRFLTMARAGNCQVLVCVNKIDLAPRDAVEATVEPYRQAGIEVRPTSALTGEGVAALREALAAQLVVFVGPSGAGKSSLLNAMAPDLNLRTRGLTASGKGSHTTNWAAVYPVGDALMVDTPGLREIGFLDDEADAAADDLFPEITVLAAACRFSDCTHTHEPRCAVKAALEAGDLDPGTYRRYARLARRLTVNAPGGRPAILRFPPDPGSRPR
jgi:ribosome biogenesis GTPase